MRNRTFFYKFEKGRYIGPITSFRSEEAVDEEKKLQIEELIQKGGQILELAESYSSTLESYFESRKIKKTSYYNSGKITKESLEKIINPGINIIRISFNKILNKKHISEIENFLNINFINFLKFDTGIQARINTSHEIFIKNLKDQLNIRINEISSDGLDIFTPIFLINSIEPDTYNRNDLVSKAEGLENIILDNNFFVNKPILVTFSHDIFKNGEFQVINELITKYKGNQGIVIANQEEIKEKTRNKNNFSISFLNFPKDFFEIITNILDGVLGIADIGYSNENLSQKCLDHDILINPIGIGACNYSELPTICIADNAISLDGQYLNNNLITYGNAYGTVENSDHGNRVASLCIYGNVNSTTTQIRPYSKIYSITGNQILSNIERVINEATANHCKIINLSLGIKNGHLGDNETISSIAKKIDEFLVNKDILVIFSAGNIEGLDDYHQFHHEITNINIPKDSISSICVGSHNENRNRVSIFSRKNNLDVNEIIGDMKLSMMCVSNKRKPEFIELGEGCSFDGNNWSYDHGTSFSAPLISNYSSLILQKYRNISTNSIKCLLLNYTHQIRAENLRTYGDNNYFYRHIGWGTVDIGAILNENESCINIIIEDYIGTNERKEYPFKLPEINNNESIWISRSISYNPKINPESHLRYCGFGVASNLWSDTYESIKQSFWTNYNDKSTEEKAEIKKDWNQWKDQHKTRKWLNWHGDMFMWNPLHKQEHLVDKEEYDELNNNGRITIEGKSEYDYKQKFSYVMTINISSILDQESYVNSFIGLNQENIIKGDNINDIDDNIRNKNNAFNELSNLVEVQFESLENIIG